MAIINPVIGWGAVDATRPTIKKLVSAIGWGFSAMANSVWCTQVAILMFGRSNPGATSAPWWVFAIGILAGLCLFLILTGGQIYTIGESRWGYRFFLLPDCMITAWQSARVITMFIELLIPATMIARIITGVVSAVIGLASAKLPEMFMFGNRQNRVDDADL